MRIMLPLLGNQRLWKACSVGCEDKVQAGLVRQQRNEPTAAQNLVVLMRNQEQQGPGQRADETRRNHYFDPPASPERAALQRSNRARRRPRTSAKVRDSSGRQYWSHVSNAK